MTRGRAAATFPEMAMQEADMTGAPTEQVAGVSKGAGLFARVVVGVDDTPESLDAVRQAASLAVPRGTFRVVSVEDYAEAVQAGAISPELAKDIEDASRAALEAALREVPEAETMTMTGGPATALIEAATRDDATVLAVGAHRRSRALGIILGSVMTNALHRAVMAVYVARPVGSDGMFPRSVIVGVDGSEPSLRAYEAARELADRFGVPLRAIAASAGEVLHEEGLSLVPDLERIGESPVAALEDRAKPGDVLVVGSRGVHGLAALGSVSERVAHTAVSSVLVVRNGS
jgi:nucleotide-binding universal stress UspA family protein